MTAPAPAVPVGAAQRTTAPWTAPRPRNVAYALAATFSVGMLWFVSNAFFWLDDYELQSLAYAAPWFTWEYLAQPWGGHFMPAAFALAQGLAKATPFTYVPMIALVSAGMATSAFGLARLFIYVLGDRWRALVPLALVLASGAMWDAATWWIAALNAVPLLAAIPFATLWHLQWLQQGSWRAGLQAWGVVALACLFFEKSLGLLFFLALVTLALRGRWLPPRPIWQMRALLLLYVAAAAFVVIGYVASSTGGVARATDLPTLLEFLRVGGLTFPPLLLGGPWWWSPPSIAATPFAIALACSLIVVAWALWQTRRARRAGLLWAGILMYVVALIAVVAAGRAGWGVQVIAQPRYFVDAVVYAIVASALAWAYLPGPAHTTRTRSRWRRGAMVVSAIAFTEFLVLGLALTIPFLARAMQDNGSRLYVVGAVTTLTEGDVTINNGLVPGNVMWPLVQPRNQLRFVFSPVIDADRLPDVRDSLSVLDGFGQLRPGEVVDDPVPAPSGSCPWPLLERQTVVTLPVSRPDYWHTVRFAYLAGAPTSIEVSLDDGTPAVVPLSSGLHQAYAFIDGGGDQLTFTRIPDGVTICITEAAIGFAAERIP